MSNERAQEERCSINSNSSLSQYTKQLCEFAFDTAANTSQHLSHTYVKPQRCYINCCGRMWHMQIGLMQMICEEHMHIHNL